MKPFKEIPLLQGSPEWLSWRKTVITATDASILMGNNPWETPYMCWQRKLGLLEEKKSNEAMERGKRLEPEAREQFIDRFAVHMDPKVVESTEFDFVGASLDGISSCNNFLLEVKCGGAKLHDMARSGEIPAYYKDQIQHQLLVTGASMCFYYSYDGTDGICIEVLPDPEFRVNFMPKARDFWKCVAFEEPPALQAGDYKDMSGEGTWVDKALKYKGVSEQIKDLEILKEEYRKDLLKCSGDQNCRGVGINVTRCKKQGAIAYDEIPELKGVDIDKYRKSATQFWKITLS